MFSWWCRLREISSVLVVCLSGKSKGTSVKWISSWSATVREVWLRPLQSWWVKEYPMYTHVNCQVFCHISYPVSLVFSHTKISSKKKKTKSWEWQKHLFSNGILPVKNSGCYFVEPGSRDFFSKKKKIVSQSWLIDSLLYSSFLFSQFWAFLFYL